ncbi:hypothetical protein RW1_009_00970 [Rhodococcus wratislaviensis NBRC 100605]|uniref:Uncharacterized protein n=1 Tax=Rhodococcus wratislaviensis NBRC 100605 TaxID=1219028 RepID=X0PMI5_RHOWR|nr:hypothetical protein RW1_009_00970 [Rhodococcus wratislaviensis NBRC 100605]
MNVRGEMDCSKLRRTSPWNSKNDNHILDFALLWEPLGGPQPEHVASAFSIDVREYHYRLRRVASRQLSRVQQGLTSPEEIYGFAAITALDRRSSEKSPFELSDCPSGLSQQSRPSKLLTSCRTNRSMTEESSLPGR